MFNYRFGNKGKLVTEYAIYMLCAYKSMIDFFGFFHRTPPPPFS